MPDIRYEDTKSTGISLVFERIAGVAILLGLMAWVCGFDAWRMAEAAGAAILLALGRLAWTAVQRQRRLRHHAAAPRKVALPHTRPLR